MWTPEKQREYMKQYYKSHKEEFAKKAKDWARANPEKRREISSKHGRSIKGRISKAKWFKDNWENIKHKVAAKNSVHRAVRKGVLIKGLCAVCGDVRVEAHHTDYTKPLDVVWLCDGHHQAVHGRRKDLENWEEMKKGG